MNKARSTMFMIVGSLSLIGCQSMPESIEVASAPVPSAPEVRPLVKPLPPMGAAPTTIVPPVRLDGKRQTINRDISDGEMVWHLRSALKVAAISCRGLSHADLKNHYTQLLKTHSRYWNKLDKQITDEYKRQYKEEFRPEIERHRTKIYNFWSLPPMRHQFCDTAMRVSATSVTVKTNDLEAFSRWAIDELERPFIKFFDAFEQYQRDYIAWERQQQNQQGNTSYGGYGG